MSESQIRVRFAPSPTGPLHIGGVRTALYNFLFARNQGGKVILRIEDTDRNRYVPGAEAYIIEALSWCGISFDEDPQKGGPSGPYRQSERRHMYKDYAVQLVAGGHAYYAFDTAEDLDQMRDRLKSAEKNLVQYGPSTRMDMQNSLSLPAEEVKKRLDNGDPYVIRIRIPENETVRVDDLIRGEVLVQSNSLDDKVLYKSDGWPTYHLANIVDDHLMGITHVIRGEEWLPSAPLHVLLYRFLGWDKEMPRFAHLPLLLKPEGNGKLSKRDGDRLGFPVFPLQWKDPATGELSSGYRESGYLPEAFVNMLALLGWNPGTEQEIFSMEELVKSFSLERVGKHGSKFDPEKAKWFNHQYMIRKSDPELAGFLQQDLDSHGITVSLEIVLKVVALVRERVNLFPDLWINSWFFFTAPEKYDEKVYHKIWKPETSSLLKEFTVQVANVDPWEPDPLQAFVHSFIESRTVKMGQLMNPLRLLIVGSNLGPGIIDIASVIGKQEFLHRIETGLENLNDGK